MLQAPSLPAWTWPMEVPLANRTTEWRANASWLRDRAKAGRRAVTPVDDSRKVAHGRRGIGVSEAADDSAGRKRDAGIGKERNSGAGGQVRILDCYRRGSPRGGGNAPRG